MSGLTESKPSDEVQHISESGTKDYKSLIKVACCLVKIRNSAKLRKKFPAICTTWLRNCEILNNREVSSPHCLHTELLVNLNMFESYVSLYTILSQKTSDKSNTTAKFTSLSEFPAASGMTLSSQLILMLNEPLQNSNLSGIVFIRPSKSIDCIIFKCKSSASESWLEFCHSVYVPCVMRKRWTELVADCAQCCVQI